MSARGCTCMPPYHNNFKDALTLHPIFNNGENAIVVGLIKEISKDSIFLSVDVIELISGNVPSTRVIVAGQDGINCGVPFSNGFFKVNDTLVMCLIDDFIGRQDTLELNDCSLSYLKCSNGTVTGNITHEIQKMGYEEFKDFVKNGFIMSANSSISMQNEIRYTYDPYDKSILIINPIGFFTDFRIYDLTSKLVDAGKIRDSQIPIIDLRNNIYFIQLFKGTKVIASIKLMVNNLRPLPI